MKKESVKEVPLVKVQCQECEKVFRTRRLVPECPECNGLDIDLYYEKGNK